VTSGTTTTASVVVRNNGGASVTISGLSIVDDAGGVYAVLTAAPLTLAPGESAVIDVSLSPQGVGATTARLVITSDDPDGAVDVALSGAGTAIRLDGLVLTLGDVAGDAVITVHGDLSVSASAGGEVVSRLGGVVDVVGTSGTNVFQFEDGGAIAGSIGGSGSVILDYTGYSPAITVDLGEGTATGTGGIAGANVAGVIGGSSGQDTLKGPAGGSRWNATATGEGDVTTGGAVVAYESIERLVGGVGDDIFTYGPQGPPALEIDGGAGSDTLEGPSFDSDWVVTSANSGPIDRRPDRWRRGRVRLAGGERRPERRHNGDRRPLRRGDGRRLGHQLHRPGADLDERRR
jgi:hypothetical protein